MPDPFKVDLIGQPTREVEALILELIEQKGDIAWAIDEVGGA